MPRRIRLLETPPYSDDVLPPAAMTSTRLFSALPLRQTCPPTIHSAKDTVPHIKMNLRFPLRSTAPVRCRHKWRQSPLQRLTRTVLLSAFPAPLALSPQTAMLARLRLLTVLCSAPRRIGASITDLSERVPAPSKVTSLHSLLSYLPHSYPYRSFQPP